MEDELNLDLVNLKEDDDDNIEEIIIIDDEEDVDSDKELETEDDIVLSQHKIEGKHSLRYDSIFKGNKTDQSDIDESYLSVSYNNDSIEVDRVSIYYEESINNENYMRNKLLKERVYETLKERTDLKFTNNRRKPSKEDFNRYFILLKRELKKDNFTNIDIFNELSVYFSDNLFNMFKLLNNRWRNEILKELQDHIGKNTNSSEIINRNIYEGTELEFLWEDMISGEEKIITGVVIETDYENSMFRIDSFESIYDVSLKNVTKILNNTKFRYNLNKIEYIDFL